MSGDDNKDVMLPGLQAQNYPGQDALLSQAGKEPQDCEAMVSPQDCGPPSLPTARSQAWMPT